MVDEDKDGRSFRMVVRVASPSGCLASPFSVVNFKRNQLARHSAAVDLTNSVEGARVCGCCYADPRIAMLSARKRHARAMHGVAADDVQYLGIFLAGRAECTASGGYIIK